MVPIQEPGLGPGPTQVVHVGTKRTVGMTFGTKLLGYRVIVS